MSDESSTVLGKLSEEINRLSKRVAELEQRNQELEAENQHLKDLLHRQGVSKDAKAPQFKENYSVDQHKGKGNRGRQSTGRRGQKDSLSDKAIAEQLNVSLKTAQNYVQHLKVKLDVDLLDKKGTNSRVSLCMEAIRRKLLIL